LKRECFTEILITLEETMNHRKINKFVTAVKIAHLIMNPVELTREWSDPTGRNLP
jgi:hypothetical protein